MEIEDRMELVLLGVAACCVGGGVVGAFLYAVTMLARSAF